MTEQEEFRELSSRTYKSLEEQWEILIARLMNLDQREALVKVFNKAAFDIVTPEIRRVPPLLRRRLQRRPGKVEIIPPKRGKEPPPDGLPEDFHE